MTSRQLPLIIPATPDYGEAGFASNIVALANAGCKVIADDVTYYGDLAFQDGVIGQAIDQVATTDGVTYFSSAGNFGHNAWGGAWSAGASGTIGAKTETMMQFASGQDYLPLIANGNASCR